MTKICSILATNHEGLVGLYDEISNTHHLPWYIPEDLAFFKKTTLNHPMIMGRNTFNSFPKPLPNRTHYVLSSDAVALQKNNFYESVIFVKNLEIAIELAKKEAELKSLDKIFIVGGASLYQTVYEENIADEWLITWTKKVNTENTISSINSFKQVFLNIDLVTEFKNIDIDIDIDNNNWQTSMIQESCVSEKNPDYQFKIQQYRHN